MKRILITGADSYIGTSFEKYIKSLHSEEYTVDTMDMIDGSWREKSFSGYDCVFHVAGIAHRRETRRNEELYYSVNRDLARHTAAKAKADGVRHFVFLSSMSVYGMESGEVDLQNGVFPISNYGKSKLQAEQLLEEISSESFTVTVLRPPMVYGKGCRGNCNFLRKWIRLFHIFPDYENRRSMISIENLVAYVREVIDAPYAGVLFPRDAEYMSTTDLVRRLAEEESVRVCYTGIFNPLIRRLRLRLVLKVFGDYTYKDVNA